MIVRFLADEDLKGAVAIGLRLHEPTIDILDVKSAGLRGARDAALLKVAYTLGRVLVSYDRHTMTRHFFERLASGKESAGLCLYPQDCPIGTMIDELLMIWAASTAEEGHNRIEFLPYR